jgi:hypothetical protein
MGTLPNMMHTEDLSSHPIVLDGSDVTETNLLPLEVGPSQNDLFLGTNQNSTQIFVIQNPSATSDYEAVELELPRNPEEVDVVDSENLEDGWVVVQIGSQNEDGVLEVERVVESEPEILAMQDESVQNSIPVEQLVKITPWWMNGIQVLGGTVFGLTLGLLLGQNLLSILVERWGWRSKLETTKSAPKKDGSRT